MHNLYQVLFGVAISDDVSCISAYIVFVLFLAKFTNTDGEL